MVRRESPAPLLPASSCHSPVPEAPLEPPPTSMATSYDPGDLMTGVTASAPGVDSVLPPLLLESWTAASAALAAAAASSSWWGLPRSGLGLRAHPSAPPALSAARAGSSAASSVTQFRRLPLPARGSRCCGGWYALPAAWLGLPREVSLATERSGSPAGVALPGVRGSCAGLRAWRQFACMGGGRDEGWWQHVGVCKAEQELASPCMLVQHRARSAASAASTASAATSVASSTSMMMRTAHCRQSTVSKQ